MTIQRLGKDTKATKRSHFKNKIGKSTPDREKRNNRKMRTHLYRLCQCTYGILQTFLGFCLFLIYCKEKHNSYHGAVVTEWKHGGSVSLGMFLFVSVKYKERSSAEVYNELVAHEYGHSIQSLILGPLYLIVIGIPSFLWAAVPAFRKMRRKRNISYDSFYTESWANVLGERLNS